MGSSRGIQVATHTGSTSHGLRERGRGRWEQHGIKNIKSGHVDTTPVFATSLYGYSSRTLPDKEVERKLSFAHLYRTVQCGVFLLDGGVDEAETTSTRTSLSPRCVHVSPRAGATVLKQRAPSTVLKRLHIRTPVAALSRGHATPASPCRSPASHEGRVEHRVGRGLG